jgi:hypothetical protein
MTALKHNATEFKNSNPDWAARTASRLHNSWQAWQMDATNHKDDLAQSIANERKEKYLDFIAKYATDKAARAVANEMATLLLETNRNGVMKVISTVAHRQLSQLLTAQARQAVAQ